MIKFNKWGKWTDVSTGEVGDLKYILQLRRHKNGKIQMRVEHVSNAYGCDKPSIDFFKQNNYTMKETIKGYLIVYDTDKWSCRSVRIKAINPIEALIEAERKIEGYNFRYNPYPNCLITFKRLNK